MRKPTVWMSSKSWCSRLVNDTLPSHSLSIIRIAVGLLYLWFGLLKLPFIPGHSPDEEVIRNTIGLFMNPDTLVLLSGIMESLLGFLLLTGLWTRILGVIMIGHVCGTFATFFINPGYLIESHQGIYSLSFAGQYIVKNILLLASGFVLALHQPRSYPRIPLRLQVGMKAGNRSYRGLSLDVSFGGMSLLLPTGDVSWSAPSGDIELEVLLPLEKKSWIVACHMVYSYFIREKERVGICLGCRFLEQTEVIETVLEPYMSGDGNTVLRRLGKDLETGC